MQLTLATQACFKDFDLEVPTAETVRYYMGVPIETFIPELVEKQASIIQLNSLKHYVRQFSPALWRNRTGNNDLVPADEGHADCIERCR